LGKTLCIKEVHIPYNIHLIGGYKCGKIVCQCKLSGIQTSCLKLNRSDADTPAATLHQARPQDSKVYCFEINRSVQFTQNIHLLNHRNANVTNTSVQSLTTPTCFGTPVPSSVFIHQIRNLLTTDYISNIRRT